MTKSTYSKVVAGFESQIFDIHLNFQTFYTLNLNLFSIVLPYLYKSQYAFDTFPCIIAHRKPLFYHFNSD